MVYVIQVCWQLACKQGCMSYRFCWQFACKQRYMSYRFCWRLACKQWYISYRFAESLLASNGKCHTGFADSLLASCQQNLYEIYHCCVYCTVKSPDDGQWNCPKYVEFYSKNKFEKLVHLVGFIIRILTYLFPARLHNFLSKSLEFWRVHIRVSIKCDTSCKQAIDISYTKRVAPQYILSPLFHTLPLLWKKTKCWSWQNSLLYATRQAVRLCLSQYSSLWSSKKRLAGNYLHFSFPWSSPARERRRFNSSHLFKVSNFIIFV